jgi:hypothetical protein
MRTWKDYIKTDVKEMGYEDVDRIHLAQDRQVSGFCDNGNELSALKMAKFVIN